MPAGAARCAEDAFGPPPAGADQLVIELAATAFEAAVAAAGVLSRGTAGELDVDP